MCVCTSDAEKEKTHLADGSLYPGILSHMLASAFPVRTSIEYFDLGRLCPEMEIECCLCGSMEMNNLVCAEVPHYLFHLKTSQSPLVAVDMQSSEKIWRRS